MMKDGRRVIKLNIKDSEISKFKSSEEYRKLHELLISQLEKNLGAIPDVYRDMVEHYMSLWSIAKALDLDINVRGVSVFWQNGENQYGCKKNDSISELNKTIKQMLEVLKALGLNTSDVTSELEDI